MVHVLTKPCNLCRRNKIAQVAGETWPGNSIPTFKNNEDGLEKVNAMAIQLEPECLPYLSRVGIKQHIFDCLNERRRCITQGYDYEKVWLYFVYSLL